MPDIAYRARGFGQHWGKSFHGYQCLSVDWVDLVWAALTVGKPDVSSLLVHGWHSWAHLISRALTLDASLKQAGTSLEKSTLYDSLDPTEKGATSYFLAMVMAKMFTHQLLNIPWLFHLSICRELGIVIGLKGKSQPDLVGMNHQREWVVVEAKGRTLGYNLNASRAGKKQTRMLRTINGSNPVLRMVVQSYFSPYLAVDLLDPEESHPSASDVQVRLDDGFRHYYSFFGMLDDPSEERTIDNIAYRLKSMPEIGVTIGLRNDYFTALKDEPSRIVMDHHPGSVVSKLSATERVYLDGIVVHLDERWSNERMSQSPNVRRVR